MEDLYGSDYMTIEDEDGAEYEIEVLSTLEWNGCSYMAVIPAGAEECTASDIAILKSVEEDGDSILTAIEDEQELETVYGMFMDQLYEDEDTEEI